MIFIALGWLATTAYLIGHLYLAVKPDFQARIYYGLNLFGGVGFVISSAAIASWQSVIINIFCVKRNMEPNISLRALEYTRDHSSNQRFKLDFNRHYQILIIKRPLNAAPIAALMCFEF